MKILSFSRKYSLLKEHVPQGVRVKKEATKGGGGICLGEILASKASNQTPDP